MPEREPLSVHLGADARRFVVSGRSQGVQLLTGATSDLPDVVRAAVAWRAGGFRPFGSCAVCGLTELAEAHERGQAAAVDVRAPERVRRTGLPLRSAFSWSPRARLRQRPISSHWTLGSTSPPVFRPGWRQPRPRTRAPPRRSRRSDRWTTRPTVALRCPPPGRSTGLPGPRTATGRNGPPEARFRTGRPRTAYYGAACGSLAVVRVVDRDRRLVALLVGDLGVEGDGLPLRRVLHGDLAVPDGEPSSRSGRSRTTRTRRATSGCEPSAAPSTVTGILTVLPASTLLSRRRRRVEADRGGRQLGVVGGLLGAERPAGVDPGGGRRDLDAALDRGRQLVLGVAGRDLELFSPNSGSSFEPTLVPLRYRVVLTEVNPRSPRGLLPSANSGR